MNVTFLYREARPGGFSIEEVFRNVRLELPGSIHQQQWYIDGHKSRLSNILKAGSLESDVYHITGDCNYLALNLSSAKTILTVHDVGHYEKTLKGIKKFVYGKLWWDLPLRRVGHITAISDYTKERIQKNFNVDPRKIKVIYNPLPEGFSFHPSEFNAEKPRILQIGGGANKNIERLIEAVAGITCHLVLVQQPSQQIINRLQALNISYEIHYRVTREELKQLYASSDMLYFASTYEGFGLPIIEAQLIGRPVITSTVASMPEIAGNSACLVDPYSVEEICNAIVRLKTSNGYAEELIQKGLNNIKRFETKHIADQYSELYHQVYRS